jgi:hypothetical protein
MFVTKRKLNSWKLRVEHGDFTALAKKTGVNRQRLSRALNSCTMPDRIYYILHDYFESKKQG